MQEDSNHPEDDGIGDADVDAIDRNLSPAAGYPDGMSDTAILFDLHYKNRRAIDELTALLEDESIKDAFRNPLKWERRYIEIRNRRIPPPDEEYTIDGELGLLANELLDKGADAEAIRSKAKEFVDVAMDDLAERKDDHLAYNALILMRMEKMPMLHSLCEWARFVKTVTSVVAESKRALDAPAAEG